MANKKVSSDIFGTFLDSVDPGPSKSSVDVSQVTQNVIGWLKQQQGDDVKPAIARGNVAVIPQLMRAIAEAERERGEMGSSSVIDLVKSTKLDVDTVASALRDATATGLLLAKEQPDGTRSFNLTPDGRLLLDDL